MQGYKFDLRMYVLVTSVNPLEAFLYQEGFCQFSNRPYAKDQEESVLGGQRVSFETLEEELVGFREKLWSRLR